MCSLGAQLCHGFTMPVSAPLGHWGARELEFQGLWLGRTTLTHLLDFMIFSFFNTFFILFIYFWLCWVFVSVRGLPLVAVSGGHSSLRRVGLSLSRPLLLQSTSSRRAGSVVVAHGPTRSAACEIFPDQGSNPCPLRWQADSQPLRHQGSPMCLLLQMCKNYEHKEFIRIKIT